jgi:hypothetical protein
MDVTHDRERDATCIVNAMTELQALARAASQSSTAAEFGISFQVIWVAGARYAWRLIEAERFSGGSRHQKRMLCFESLEEIHNVLEERLAWVRADQEFRATYMVTPGGFPGVTADWVHTKDFDVVFGPSRYLLRKELCATTAPDR